MMDADDDDEYMNAVAAHAAFLITVLEARMYWLLRHAQHARYINIHKLHPLSEEIGVGSADFLRDSTWRSVVMHETVLHCSPSPHLGYDTSLLQQLT